MHATQLTQGIAVLVVDDTLEVRESVAAGLTALGARVVTAADGNEAVLHIGQGRFDVAVVDILMPEKDGIETILDIRERWPHMAIVAMSGGGRIGQDEVLALAANLGAHATLTKPFTLEQLESAMLRADAAAALWRKWPSGLREAEAPLPTAKVS
jgi:CheY-like chemotaxis protein